MENTTIELNEPKLKMFEYMVNNFDFYEFIAQNPEIVDEGSVGWYEDNFNWFLNDIAEINIVNNL